MVQVVTGGDLAYEVSMARLVSLWMSGRLWIWGGRWSELEYAGNEYKYNSFKLMASVGEHTNRVLICDETPIHFFSFHPKAVYR